MAYQPDYITSFNYPIKEGKLTGHVDKVLGWVVLFSLGNTAKFYIKGPNMRERVTIDFQSGDVLVFNGGTEYDIFHGIDTIVEGSCPSHLSQELGESRVSLQMRQTERNDNKPYRDYNKKKRKEEKKQQREQEY